MNKFITMVAVAALTLSLGGCGDAGDGEKIGTFVKVTQTGFFCKTWEAEMIRGGMSGGSGVTGQAFDVTIENNPELLQRVKDAMDQQKEIKIQYHQERATWCRSDSGDTFLVGMKDMTRPTTTLNTNVSGKVTVDGDVAVHQETPNETEGRTHDQKVEQLLQVQAELIKELAKK